MRIPLQEAARVGQLLSRKEPREALARRLLPLVLSLSQWARAHSVHAERGSELLQRSLKGDVKASPHEALGLLREAREELEEALEPEHWGLVGLPSLEALAHFSVHRLGAEELVIECLRSLDTILQGRRGHWGAHGAGVVIVAESSGELLLLLRSSEVRQGGTWGIPGGALNPGESPEQAAARETEEETGAEAHGKDLELLSIYEAPTGFTFSTFLGRCKAPFEPDLGWEADDYRWDPPGDLPDSLHPGLAFTLAFPGVQEKLSRRSSGLLGLFR